MLELAEFLIKKGQLLYGGELNEKEKRRFYVS